MSNTATANQPQSATDSPNPVRGLIMAILVLSVLLRIVVSVYFGSTVPPNQDDHSYSELAARLTSGYGFSFDRPWYPYRQPAGTPTAHWSFLYTAFVAGIYAVVGVHPLAVRLVQSLLGGVLLPWMTYRLSRRVGATHRRGQAEGQRGGGDGEGESSGAEERGTRGLGMALVAAGIAAVYGYFVLYAARPVTETFYIVALLWSLERALALAEAPTVGKGAVLGLALGLAALLRQSIVPWVPVLFLWLLWRSWRDSRSSGTGRQWNVRTLNRLNVQTLLVSALVLAACIAPFTIRNYLVYGDFLLLNSNAGYAMYSAQHPMHGTSFQEYAAAPLPADLRGQGLNEAQWDRELMRRGIRFVLDEPGRYLLLSLSRVRDTFEFWPTADSSLLYNVGRVTSFGLFLPFMVYGIILALRRATPLRSWGDLVRFSVSPVALLLVFMAFYSLLHILTWAMTRYRLPVDAVAIIFAALAISDLAPRFLPRHKSAVPDPPTG
jgi:hypothetical protein